MNLSIIEAIFKKILNYIQPYTIITVMGYSVASTKKVITILYTSNITLTHTHKNSKVRVKNNTTPQTKLGAINTTQTENE